jgi:chromosome segregation ATPase
MTHKTSYPSILGYLLTLSLGSYAQACYSTNFHSKYQAVAAEEHVKVAIAEKERLRRQLQEVELKGTGKRPAYKQASRWLTRSPPPGSTTPVSDLVRAWILQNPAPLATVSASTTNDQQFVDESVQVIKARVRKLEKDIAAEKAITARQTNCKDSVADQAAVDRAHAWWHEYQGEFGRHEQTKEHYRQVYVQLEQSEQEGDHLRTTIEQLQTDIQKARGEAVGSTTAFHQQIQQLEDTIAALRNEIYDMRMTSGKHDSNNKKLRAQNQGLVLENQTASARINDLEINVVRLRGEREGYRNDVRRLQREQKELEARIVRPLRAEIQRLRDENQQQLHREMQPLQDQITNLRREMLEEMNELTQQYDQQKGVLREQLRNAREDYHREHRRRRRLAVEYEKTYEELEARKRSQGHSRKKRTLCDMFF